jgi:hypothetical protein
MTLYMPVQHSMVSPGHGGSTAGGTGSGSGTVRAVARGEQVSPPRSRHNSARRTKAGGTDGGDAERSCGRVLDDTCCQRRPGRRIGRKCDHQKASFGHHRGVLPRPTPPPSTRRDIQAHARTWLSLPWANTRTIVHRARTTGPKRASSAACTRAGSTNAGACVTSTDRVGCSSCRRAAAAAAAAVPAMLYQDGRDEDGARAATHARDGARVAAGPACVTCVRGGRWLHCMLMSQGVGWAGGSASTRDQAVLETGHRRACATRCVGEWGQALAIRRTGGSGGADGRR